MKLTHITFTGIDTKTDLQRVERLNKKYPYAEFGVLISMDWFFNGNRFPNPEIFFELEKYNINLSAHMCGSIARDAVKGNFSGVVLLNPSKKYDMFRRYQLNVDAEGKFSDLRNLRLSALSVDEVIIQMKRPDCCRHFTESGDIPDKMSFLLDASGGTGKDTPIQIITHPDVHIGYAGGIGPDNVESKLKTLLSYPSDDHFWIDMESRIRTNDWLDLDKVERVLDICDPLIREYNI